ncbi:MAG: hypothetical protein JEZ00_07705 [Anaerolineaceae bacterium]|nr:hypothetical protein [Anaerolineaceae bacterium]
MDENKVYRWVTHGVRNCEHCAALEGKEMRFSEWFHSVLPGIHAGCDCSLEPVNDEEASEEINMVYGQLKSLSGPKKSTRVSVDQRITNSHKALKPMIEKSKAVLPLAKQRPINIAHYGG